MLVHDSHRVIDQIGMAHVHPTPAERGTGCPKPDCVIEHAAHERQLLGAGLVPRPRLRGERANPLHSMIPGHHELCRLAMGLDEDGIRIGFEHHLELAEMERRLEQPETLPVSCRVAGAAR